MSLIDGLAGSTGLTVATGLAGGSDCNDLAGPPVPLFSPTGWKNFWEKFPGKISGKNFRENFRANITRWTAGQIYGPLDRWTNIWTGPLNHWTIGPLVR